MASIVLNDAQLRKLAEVIYYKEAAAIQNVRFKSEYERANYLRSCLNLYQSTLALLDAGAQSEHKCQDDSVKAPIAHDVFSYVQRCVNFGLQHVRNYTVRMEFVNKIREHADALLDALYNLDPMNTTNAGLLAKEANRYKDAMIRFNDKYRKGAPSWISKWIKEEHVKFHDVVARIQKKLGFEGPFKDLEDAKKLKVYEIAIEESGEGKKLETQISKAFGAAGVAVLLLTAGIMAWDAISSEHELETAVRDATQVASGVGGAMLEEVVAAALRGGMFGFDAAPIFVTMAGLVTGFVGCFIIGEFAGLVLDSFFSSGGTHPLSTEGYRCYVAPMPDGEVLARQIAHQDELAD